MRRRDDAHADAEAGPAADALEGAVLQHAQETDLRLERELGHLVEEEGAAVRALEPPEPHLARPREASAFVAEELRVDQLGRDGATVDPQHGAARAARARVEHPRDQLLARSRLPLDEDGGVRGRDPLDVLDDVTHPVARPHDGEALGVGFGVELSRAFEGGRRSDVREGPSVHADVIVDTNPLDKNTLRVASIRRLPSHGTGR